MSCTEENFEQTLFLGCSVKEFKCSLGWNESPSNLTVTIVRDNCASPPEKHKVYYSTPGIKSITTDPDPGFFIYGEGGGEAPEIGSPCYFRFGNFEFSGLIQSWQQIEPGSDVEQYQIILSAPTELLQGCSLILGEFSGPTPGFNIFNVYGAAEYLYGNKVYNDLGVEVGASYTQYAPDGYLFGTAAQGYGGADLNEAGMPWAKVKDCLLLLTSSIPIGINAQINNFSQYGRIAFSGAAVGGYGLLAADSVNVTAGEVFGYAKYLSYYTLDLSDVPFSVSDLRINGPTSDILTVLSQVCQDLAHDFFIELVPVSFGGTTLKVIKVRTVSRVNQPPTNIVAQYVDYLTSAGTVSSSYGRELRNESTTNFLIGGRKRTMYQTYNSVPPPGTDIDDAYLETLYPGNTYVKDVIVPYYGKDSSGNLYVEYDPSGDEDNKFIMLDLTNVKPSLNLLGAALPNRVPLSVKQIKYAATSYSAWLQALTAKKNTTLYKLVKAVRPQLASMFDREVVLPAVEAAVGQTPPIKARDRVKILNQNLADKELEKDLKKLYEAVSEVAQNAINKIMVRLPFVAAKYQSFSDSEDPVEGRIITSDSPTDGGWTENPNILGLANPGPIIDFFKNTDGSIHSMAAYPYESGLNIDILDGVKYYYENIETDPEEPQQGMLFVEVDVDPDLVFIDKLQAKSPRAVVNIPKLYNVEISTAAKHALRQVDLGVKARLGQLNKEEEAEINSWGEVYENIEPYAVAIAFESKENRYGPWKPDNVIEAGPPGRINISQDESLVPWAYGSYANMDTIGQAYANASVGGMNFGENGSITVDGYPAVPLGSELASAGGLANKFYTGDTHLYENRSTSPYNISANGIVFSTEYIPYGVFTGQYGPNITGIEIDVGIGGIQTTYTFRTYSPKFGTLSKSKADAIGARMKQLNKLRSEINFKEKTRDIQIGNMKRLGIKNAI